MQAIEVRNLIKKYDKITVLDNLDLIINEGEFYCLMGPKWIGKNYPAERIIKFYPGR